LEKNDIKQPVFLKAMSFYAGGKEAFLLHELEIKSELHFRNFKRQIKSFLYGGQDAGNRRLPRNSGRDYEDAVLSGKLSPPQISGTLSKNGG
jgi:hypothetical protein